ncbi:MAG: type 1 fimbrial protein [Gibbsiella quercinecans]|uniref:type 1 fimbrial protein n=1 Tax=Gibbsiella quercinecans TaxID=929813 RepID=UPI003F2AD41A
MNTCRLLVIVGVLFSWTMASQAKSSGTIYFTGAVAESPCSFKVSATVLKTTCYRDGSYLQGQQRTLQNRDFARGNLPQNLGFSEVSWVNQQQKLAMMTITYN